MSQGSPTWRTVRLDEVCEVNPRYPVPDNPAIEVSFVPMPAVSDVEGAILPHDSRPFSKVAKGYTRFRNGDVIFAKITPCMENGKVALANGLRNGLACGSTEFHVLRSNGTVLPEYLWRFLRQDSFRGEAQQRMTGAVGQRRVPVQFLKESRIPLPPLAEQRSIIAKLDNLFARSKNARVELDHIPRLIERYKQAVLTAAFCGDLTKDWRGKRVKPEKNTLEDVVLMRSAHFKREGAKEKSPAPPSWKPPIDLPPGWEWASVDQLTTRIQYGSSSKTSDSATASVPVLRMGNILDGHLDYRRLKYLPKTHSEFPELLLKDGDILFNRTNSAELVGKTAVYSDTGRPMSFASYLIRMRVIGYFPELLSAYINSAFGREWVRSVVNQQVGQANVNGTKLRELGVPLMPMDEQKELWFRVKKAFTAIDHLATEATRATELLDRLDQATLAKAFRGELLPPRAINRKSSSQR